jgi:hypothetical protein
MLPIVPEEISTLSKQIQIVTSVISYSSAQLHNTYVAVQALHSEADSKLNTPRISGNHYLNSFRESSRLYFTVAVPT